VSSGTRDLSCSVHTEHEDMQMPTVFRSSGTSEMSCSDKTESRPDRVPLVFRKSEHEGAPCPTLRRGVEKWKIDQALYSQIGSRK
jgi:hypothetical protein